MQSIFERLDGVDASLNEVSKNPLIKVYPLLGQILKILFSMASIARDSISNVDAALAHIEKTKADNDIDQSEKAATNGS